MATDTKRTRTKPVELPPDGVQPNVLARVLKAQDLLAERVANAGDPQEIGKRHFRPFLRGTYGATHERHAPWNLDREQMLAILDRFGNERARAYVKNAKRTK